MKNIDEKPRAAADDFDRYIERTINLRIRKIALQTFACIIAALVLIFFALSPLMNLVFPNAAKLNESEDGQESRLMEIMSAYCQTLYPNSEVFSLEVEKEGFGCYTLHMQIIDHSVPSFSGLKNVDMSMKLGRLSVKDDPQLLMTFKLGKFYNQYSEDVFAPPEEVLAALEALPDESFVYVNVTQQEAAAVTEVAEKAGGLLEWLQIYVPGDGFQPGLRMNFESGQGASGQHDGGRQAPDEAELKERCLENLRLLDENYDLWKDMGLYSNSTVFDARTDLMSELIGKIENADSLQTKNYCLAGSKEEVLAYLQDTEGCYLSVENSPAVY